MKDLFGNETPSPAGKKRSREEVLNDYDGFVEKFKPKRTTDDCYTPQPVYDAVLKWVCENVNIEGREIVRPFYPGGDYESYDYPAGCVVVDNPPFSIISKICRFYTERRISFFLFAPHLTLFSPKQMAWTGIVCNISICYENKAVINTSFLSNLFGDVRIMTAPGLYWRVKNAQEEQKTGGGVKKYRYPSCVVSSALLGKIAPYVEFSVKKSECQQVSKLDEQGKSSIFGGGFLLSDSATARKCAAEKDAKERAIARLEDKEREEIVHFWEFSEREKAIIEELE